MTPKELKNSILQLAIEGKLVEQRKEEGSAEILYAEIQKEKQKLIKQGKIKKEKELPEITDDEIPFKIPKSWKWVRLGDILNIIMGQSPEGINVSNNKKGMEFHQGKIFFGEMYLKESNFFTSEITKVANKNSVLLCVRAPVGIVNITTREICIGRGLCSINSIFGIYEKLILYFLRTFEKDFCLKSTGTTFKAITNEVVKNELFPLPPFAEQKRIVEKIEELMPLVDRYEVLYDKLNVLNKEFPKKLKNAVLQKAIQGKLVPQIKSEGSAEDLYVEIQKEKQKLIKQGKIKKEKELSEITDDEIPFEIPKSWKWVRLNDISETITKGTTPRGGNVSYIDKGVMFLRAENVAGYDKLDISNVNYVSVETHEGFLKRSILQKKDILITIAGTLGRTALVEEEYLPLNINQAISIVRLIKNINYNYKFIIFALNSAVIQKRLIVQKKITAIPNLTLEIISNCTIPLPSLTEQERIVKKIEEILQNIEKLEKYG